MRSLNQYKVEAVKPKDAARGDGTCLWECIVDDKYMEHWALPVVTEAGDTYYFKKYKEYPVQ